MYQKPGVTVGSPLAFDTFCCLCSHHCSFSLVIITSEGTENPISSVYSSGSFRANPNFHPDANESYREIVEVFHRLLFLRRRSAFSVGRKIKLRLD